MRLEILGGCHRMGPDALGIISCQAVALGPAYSPCQLFFVLSSRVSDGCDRTFCRYQPSVWVCFDRPRPRV